MPSQLDSPALAELTQLFEPIRAELEAVEDAYITHIQTGVEPAAGMEEVAASGGAAEAPRHAVDEVIPRMARYIQGSGGKRVRPAVLLMAARMCGYRGERPVVFASAVEFIHTATLVHDDVIDDSELRRGRLAMHSRWGNNMTVLLGDYLYIRAMEVALTYDDAIAIVRVLCDVTRRMIEGEIYQLTKVGAADVAEEEYFEIIRRKTAYLFSGAAEIGGLLGHVDDERRRALRRYGFNLGVAFQLVDDLLDFTADRAALGKPVGGDLREGKVTLAAIHLLRLEGPESRAHDIIRSVVETGDIGAEEWSELVALLRERRAIQYAYDAAEEYATAARQCLDAFPPSPERTALAALPDYVLARDR